MTFPNKMDSRMEDIYSSVVHGHYNNAVEKADNTSYVLCCKALAYAQLAKFQEAEHALGKIQVPDLTPQQESIYIEAKAVLALRRKKNLEANRLAEKAIQLNASAAIAHSVLGRSAEYHGKMQAAYRHFAAIAEAYPDYDAALLACSRTLFYSRKRREAEDYLKKVSATNGKKNIYNLIAAIYYRSFFARLLLVVLLIVLFAFPYTFLAFTALMIISFIFVIVRFNGDLFMTGSIAITEIVATVFSLLLTLFKFTLTQLKP